MAIERGEQEEEGLERYGNGDISLSPNKAETMEWERNERAKMDN